MDGNAGRSVGQLNNYWIRRFVPVDNPNHYEIDI